MENLIFRGRPDERNECEKLAEVLSGRPYLRLIKRMTVSEFLGTDQPAAVKQKLCAYLAVRNGAKTTNESKD